MSHIRSHTSLKSTLFRNAFLILVLFGHSFSILFAQDYSPFSTPDGLPTPIEFENPAIDGGFVNSQPLLTKNLDTIFALIGRNKRSLNASNKLDLRAISLDDQQSEALATLVIEYSEKYVAPEKAAKAAMCQYFNAPQNEIIPTSIRATNAFEMLESQADMEARWEAIGIDFLRAVRSELGEEVFQLVQSERDAIYAVGSVKPMSSKELILSLDIDIQKVVTTNCGGDL